MTSLASPPPRFGARAALDLLDWKRRIFDLYERVRATEDAEDAWNLWRDAREELYRTHPQSPLPASDRGGYGDAFFPYDSRFRVVAELSGAQPRWIPIPASTGGTFAFTGLGVIRFELLGAEYELELHWNEGYGGGILLVVADATSGRETYAGGRYVLDTVKGADLGNDGSEIIVDFNFAYNPSCAFDPRWSCPLAPSSNRLPLPLRVGERAPAADADGAGSTTRP